MRLAVLLCLTVQLLPGAVVVRIEGNFGPGSGTSTVFDNQDYLVQFTIDDPTSPASSTDNPGTGFSRVDYTASALLTVPGIGLSVPLGMPNTIEYVRSPGNFQSFDNWMNVFQFYGLPVGDFMLLVPLHTLSGAPLWNGFAAPDTPVINLFNHEPVSASWALEQIPGPGLPSVPLTGYGGIATITVQDAAAPEPSSMVLVGALCAALILSLRRSKADEFPARHPQ
jgi:hypothetical protein